MLLGAFDDTSYIKLEAIVPAYQSSIVEEVAILLPRSVGRVLSPGGVNALT